MSRALKIVSSPWVIPVSQPIIEDGSVAVADGRIVELGRRQELRKRYPAAPEFCHPGVLMPGLINAHIHLELSHLRNTPEPLPHHAITDWIADLLARRSRDNSSREERLGAIAALLQDQHDSGVVLIADTGNEWLAELEGSAGEWPKVYRMREFLGPDTPGCEAAVRAIESLDPRVTATGHAPYSTAPELLQFIKARCRQLGQIFSLHTAESSGELQFLRSRTGIFRDFLEKRNRWDGTFSALEADYAGVLDYLDRLGLLDERTLLVHCVHVGDRDLQLAAQRGVHICLCPGSNRFLKVGSAPVPKMLETGNLPALGTDSRASNPAIDLWREMQLLAEDHPALEAEQIIAMATQGGAQALHVEKDFGSLGPGRAARLLHISSSSLSQCRNAAELLREMVIGGRPTEISWA